MRREGPKKKGMIGKTFKYNWSIKLVLLKVGVFCRPSQTSAKTTSITPYPSNIRDNYV